MVAPTIKPTAMADVIEIVPVRHGDERGWFSETWNEAELAAAGITVRWVQDNESLSGPKATLRGIHFQLPPVAQDKLVRVIAGSIIDVAVDLRETSPTFKHHVAVELRADLGNQLLIPKGFGHAFCTLEENCRIAYKVSAPYAPECDRTVRFDDSELAIDWPYASSEMLLSHKDADAPSLDQIRTVESLF